MGVIRTIWTPDMLALLEQHYGSIANQKLADLIGVTKPAVSSMARRLGLSRSIAKGERGISSPWTEDALRRLHAEYPTHDDPAQLAIEIGVSLHALRAMACYRHVRRITKKDRSTENDQHAGMEDPHEGERQHAAEPASHLPGTEGKVQVMEDRASRGEWLFHPEDAPQE